MSDKPVGELEDILSAEQVDVLVKEDRIEFIYGADVVLLFVDDKTLYEYKDEEYHKIPVGGYLEVQD